MNYEVLFRDHGGKIFSRANMQAADDEAAIELADRILRTGIGSGHEIRRNGVTIHFEEYGSAVALKPTMRPLRQARA